MSKDRNNLPNLFMICLSLAIVMVSLSFDKSHEISIYKKMLTNSTRYISKSDSTHSKIKDSIIEENQVLKNSNIYLNDSIIILNKKLNNIKYILTMSKKDSL